MTRFVLKRLLQAIPLLFLITLIGFGLGAAAPVDPARMALAGGNNTVELDPADVERKRVELGLDRPLTERYLNWLGDFVTGDFGRSYMTGRPVAGEFQRTLPASLVLGLLALLTAIAVAVPLGMSAALRPGGAFDLVSRVTAVLCASVPSFWLALLAMWLFAVHLGWLPVLGSFTPAGMVLPVLVLALTPLGRLVRLMRATTLETLKTDYVKVAHGKGMSYFSVLRRHVMPNAVMPILAVLGLDLAALIANSAVVEWIFAWPGVGRMGVEAALSADLPVLMTFTVLMSILVMLANLLVDVIHGAVDPRLLEEAAR